MSESGPVARPPRFATRAKAPSSSGAHRALHVPLVVALFLVSTLVVEFLTLAQCKRDLRLAALEVDLERQQRQSLTLDRADHLADLLFVQEEFSSPRGLVIEVARLFVGRYVQIQQKDFSVFNDRVGVGDVGLSVAQRFHLAAGQNNPSFP